MLPTIQANESKSSRPSLAVKTDNLKSLFGFEGVTTFTNETLLLLLLVVLVVMVNPGDL